jgi:hypothetical protein
MNVAETTGPTLGGDELIPGRGKIPEHKPRGFVDDDRSRRNREKEICCRPALAVLRSA